MKIDIVVYPTGTNPYQHLLYAPFTHNNNVTIKFLNGKLTTQKPILLGVPTFHIRLFLYWLFILPRKSKRIFHLHWVSFSLPSKNKVIQTISFINTIISLYTIKLLGFKLVWTVHNILPHQQDTLHDRYIANLLGNLADAKIAHSNSTLTEMKKEGISTKNTVIIPIGTYEGVYENTITKEKAREQLRIPPDNFVYLFFGEIKPYKGIEDLVEAFESTVQKYITTTLVISGRCWNNNLLQRLQYLKRKYPKNVLLHIGYTPNEEVQLYFNASDIVVLPFKEITTSSSTILAFSFKRTIIVPNLPLIQELPKNILLLYNPKTASGLEDAMKKAYTNKELITQLHKKAYEYVKTLTWEKIADKTTEIYKKIS